MNFTLLLILHLHEDELQTLCHLLPDERWFDNRGSLGNCQENACDPFMPGQDV